MPIRLLASAFVLLLVPIAVRAADDENPYKNVKVGDFSTYSVKVKVAGQNLEGTVTQTVTAKSDKEVSLTFSGKIGGMAFPEQTTKIDLTKPFDPTKLNDQAQAAGSDVKVEKGKEGKETLKVAGKEYGTTWTKYKLKGKSMGVEFESDMKVWMAKDLTGVLAKMEMKNSIAGQTTEMTMESIETGNKK